ncbi:maleylpyruvate isomerase family mycothiol-dependent enzyme [Thermomonospora umbrina]|uniref:Uncharacterized protein (TIGR03083 family) n=1 Tax=Thermomonospora umbrina TaxID=111806 RepID=A0A3D9T2R7_9ACTN|nr:maleylpyruvate isomerase family mycothiol-dependent enzyme [Thermomonospora umbrina]REE99064.1 uncharacterized protein (TIGR03083 family) [Thermomonospora umbrina]
MGTPLNDLDPFDVYDAEAARLEAHFAGLTGDAWDRPSRCEGWSVRDVLAHLAGGELYNRACLDDDLQGLFALLEKEGASDLTSFNDWSVSSRRGRPVAEVLEEWREENRATRRRMRERGAEAMLPTMSGPYPVGPQTFHYSSELATHADDIGVPVAEGEEPGRSAWRARVALFALAEADSSAEVTQTDGGFRVRLDGESVDLSRPDFVAATTARLPEGHPLPPAFRDALRCLA